MEGRLHTASQGEQALETFITIIVIILLVVFHRPLGMIADGLFSFIVLGLLLSIAFVTVRGLLFGP